MIERVLLNRADVELDDVFAELTIRHGRGSIDDGPMASTATLRLVNQTRALVNSFSAGDELALLLAGDVPRFVGRITDASDAEDGLSIIAVSPLSWLSRRIVGGADWPIETWHARLLRVFQDAGALLTWPEVAGTWADGVGSFESFGLAGRLVLDLKDDGPLIAARVSSTETLGGYLGGEFKESEPAVAADLPNGAVLIQQLSARSAKPVVELDPRLVTYPPEFEQTDEVENELRVAYDDGTGENPSVTAENPSSIARFELRPADITTALTTAADAQTRADLRVNRRGFPRWHSDLVDVLYLEPAISIGTPVRLHDLPDWAPDAAYLGVVEGWEDHVGVGVDDELHWTMRLYLSDPRLSGGFGTLWVSTAKDWNQAGAATWNNPTSLVP